MSEMLFNDETLWVNDHSILSTNIDGLKIGITDIDKELS